MRLHLFRHAPARRATPDEPDRERPLCGRGARRFERAVRRLAKGGLALDLLWTSPWRRAQETALLLRPIADGPPRELELLARGPDEELLRALQALEGDERAVGLVGHQPWLGELLALLVLGSSARGPSFRLARGGLAILEGNPARGAMRLSSLRSLRELEG